MESPHWNRFFLKDCRLLRAEESVKMKEQERGTVRRRLKPPTPCLPCATQEWWWENVKELGDGVKLGLGERGGKEVRCFQNFYLSFSLFVLTVVITLKQSACLYLNPQTL